MDNKIDFVIITVDGSDPEWNKKKNLYLGCDGVDDREIRYRSWDNLKYWFRGVEKFAPWVNKVFLVTDNQVPQWINKDCKKLVLVDHKDFIPEQYLPTFSSHPIEHNIFRIKGLSDTFVYFNDDMFLLKPVKAEQFFKNGLPCDYALESPISVHDRMFAHIIANNILLLDEHYNRKEVLKKHAKKFYSPANKIGMLQNLAFRPLKRERFFGFKNYHCPSPFLKSSFEKVWEDSYKWLDETCRSKFRSDNDVNQYIYLDYQYVNGLFTPYNWGNSRFMFRVSDQNIDEVCSAIKNQEFSMICINEADELDFDAAKQKINAAWETLLPEKSIFES